MTPSFIDAHRAAWRGEPICAVLRIAPATYHAHKARPADVSRLPARPVRDGRLQAEIRRAGLKTAGSMVPARCAGSCSERACRWRRTPSSA